MATGFVLRGRMEAFQDVLTEVEVFLKEQGVPDTQDLIKAGRDAIEDLFYLIPLEDE